MAQPDPLASGALRLLRQKLRAAMNDRADHIATGGATDFADYKHHCGVVEGLALAERELLDVAASVERDE